MFKFYFPCLVISNLFPLLPTRFPFLITFCIYCLGLCVSFLESSHLAVCFPALISLFPGYLHSLASFLIIWTMFVFRLFSIKCSPYVCFCLLHSGSALKLSSFHTAERDTGSLFLNSNNNTDQSNDQIKCYSNFCSSGA